MEDSPNDTSVRSPFAGVQSSLDGKKARSSLSLTIVAILVAAILGGSFFIIQKKLSDPLRTLQSFPVDEYYENHSSLEGTRFKAELKAVNQLGWKDDIGRLVTFTVGDTKKPVVVLIPPKNDKISFQPGETFLVELKVREGGLLEANSLQSH